MIYALVALVFGKGFIRVQIPLLSDLTEKGNPWKEKTLEGMIIWINTWILFVKK
jgi:hypothetical protein